MADREEIYIKTYGDRGLKQWREKKKNLKFTRFPSGHHAN